MPWKETCVMDSRLEFVFRALRESAPFEELCREFGISRKTGYKWKERFLALGPAGLCDLSRRPDTSPAQVAEDVLCELVRIKNDHRGWGPKKIREVYARKHPHAPTPSESTVKRVLDKAGLVNKRRPRQSKDCGRIENRLTPEQPNDLWTVDFKGWWHTGRRQRCEPLTVRDAFSRFVLCAAPLEDAKGPTVRRQFERLFQTHGLPRAIRSDNGPPFACSTSPMGITKLSAWWIANGISLDRIAPGKPSQNGAHERMHLDIALEVERTPETDLQSQRAALETWRNEFNFERPHQALGMRTPGEVYRNSERPYTGQPEEIDYPQGFLTRKVTSTGLIGIDGARVCISTALHGWHVGLKPVDGAAFLVFFGPLCLGILDPRTQAFKPAAKRPAQTALGALPPNPQDFSHQGQSE